MISQVITYMKNWEGEGIRVSTFQNPGFIKGYTTETMVFRDSDNSVMRERSEYCETEYFRRDSFVSNPHLNAIRDFRLRGYRPARTVIYESDGEKKAILRDICHSEQAEAEKTTDMPIGIAFAEKLMIEKTKILRDVLRLLKEYSLVEISESLFFILGPVLERSNPFRLPQYISKGRYHDSRLDSNAGPLIPYIANPNHFSAN